MTPKTKTPKTKTLKTENQNYRIPLSEIAKRETGRFYQEALDNLLPYCRARGLEVVGAPYVVRGGFFPRAIARRIDGSDLRLYCYFGKWRAA